MKLKKVTINTAKAGNLGDLHNLLKETFGFPDFYGSNIHALIDCLSSLRSPEDAMTTLFLQKDEILLLEIEGYMETIESIKDKLVFAIGRVNSRAVESSQFPNIIISIN